MNGIATGFETWREEVGRWLATGRRGVWVPLALLFLAGIPAALSLWFWNKDQDRETLYSRTVERAERLLFHGKDAETGQRGYLLMREEPYLEPYHEALATVGQDLAALNESVANSRTMGSADRTILSGYAGWWMRSLRSRPGCSTCGTLAGLRPRSQGSNSIRAKLP